MSFSKLITIFSLLIIAIISVNPSENTENQKPQEPPTVETKVEAEEKPKKQYGVAGSSGSALETPEKKAAMNLMADFNNEWEAKMIDYNADYTYYLPLKPRIQETYFENVTQVPTTFKGAFIISDESTDKIEFMVTDPKNTIVYQQIAHHAVFEFNVTIPGRYSINFMNKYAKSDLSVTFTMTTGQNNILKSKDLTETEKKLETLSSFINKFNLEFKLGHDIHTKRYQAINRTNTFFYIFAFGETFVLIAVSIWQSYYMKHLFEVKGSL